MSSAAEIDYAALDVLSRQSFAFSQVPTGNTEGLGEGAILAGKYRVERVLGSGGMGVVVAATHLQLEERVAIKFLFLEALENAEITARFMREARAAVRIKSEHVARVIDVGTFEGGAPFIVMEYLEGSDLSQVLASRGPLPIETAVAYILQTCEALAEAHGLGIVHRDLKPSNLFVIRRPDGSSAIKVLDFGISKVLSTKSASQGDAITRTGTLLGSPLYMSPEQMTTPRQVDARSDIWALGALLFEMVTGRSPFSGETVPQLCASILDGRVPLMRTLRSDVPPALETVVARCLEKDRGRRFQTVAELATALHYLAPSSVRSYVDRITRITRAKPDPSLLVIGEGSSAERTLHESTRGNGAGRSSRRAIASFFLAGVVALGLGLALMRHFRANKTEVSTSVVLSQPPSEGPVAPPSPAEPRLEATAPLPARTTPDRDTVGSSVSSSPKVTSVRTPKAAPAPASLSAATSTAATLVPTATPTLAASVAPSASPPRLPADLFNDRK